MQRLTVKRILQLAADQAGISVGELIGPSRTDAMVRPRHRAMLVVRTCRPDMSLPEIGRRMGGRDHTTVLAGVRRARMRAEASPEEGARVIELMGLCRAEAAALRDLVAVHMIDVGPGDTDAAFRELDRSRRIDRIDRAIWLIDGVLADLQQAREAVADDTPDLFPLRAA